MMLLLIFCWQITDAIEIDLGGPRNAKVAIKELGDSYDLVVTFVPVNCFDKAVNHRLTTEKSKYYATLALVRFLRVPSNKTLSFGSAKIVGESSQGNLRRIHWEVADVQARAANGSSSRNLQRIELHPDSLLDARSEFHLTINQLAKDIANEIPTYKGNLLDYYRKMGNFEEESLVLFETLRNEIEADKLLLRIEKEELLQSIQSHETEIQEQLVQQTAMVENRLANPE